MKEKGENIFKVGLAIALLSNFVVLFGVPIENFELVRGIANYSAILMFLIATTIMTYEEEGLNRIAWVINVVSLGYVIYILLKNGYYFDFGMLPPVLLGQFFLVNKVRIVK